MNDYERRVLDCARFHTMITQAAKEAGNGAVSEYFSYTANVVTTNTPIAVGESRQQIVPIQADSDFAVVYISSSVKRTGIDLFLANMAVNFQITDTGQGVDLFSAPTNSALGAGGTHTSVSGVPMLLPIPRIIARNTNVKFDVTNNTLFELDYISITITGTRIGYRG